MSMIPAPAPSGTGTVQLLAPVTGRPVRLRGWTAKEDTGTASATVQILDAIGGNLLAGITLAANESVREFVPVEQSSDEGIAVATGGIAANRTGTATVTAFWS